MNYDVHLLINGRRVWVARGPLPFVLRMTSKLRRFQQEFTPCSA